MPGYFPTDSQWHKDMLMTQRVPPLRFEFLFLTLKKTLLCLTFEQ